MVLDIERIRRYRDKIKYIIEKLKFVPSTNLTPLEIDGIFYRLLTSIESCMDLISMLNKDLGHIVADDYSNIDYLIKENKIPGELGVKLKKSNGLRNILVHRYNSVDEEIAISSFLDVRNAIQDFISILERILNEIKKK